MIDYLDALLHEYPGWTRAYVLWGMPFARGVKHMASIVRRETGKDSIAERLKDKLLTDLAETRDRILGINETED